MLRLQHIEKLEPASNSLRYIPIILSWHAHCGHGVRLGGKNGFEDSHVSVGGWSSDVWVALSLASSPGLLVSVEVSTSSFALHRIQLYAKSTCTQWHGSLQRFAWTLQMDNRNVRMLKSRHWFFKLSRMRMCRFAIQILHDSRKPLYHYPHPPSRSQRCHSHACAVHLGVFRLSIKVGDVRVDCCGRSFSVAFCGY